MPSEGKPLRYGPAPPHCSDWKSGRSLITCWLPETEVDGSSDTPRCAPGIHAVAGQAGTIYPRVSDRLDPLVVRLVGMVSFIIIHFDWEYDAPV